jgi:protein CpxP
MVNRLGWAVDASTEQKQKITGIIQRAADDLRPLHEKHMESRRQIRDALAAPAIDRAKLEALRADHVKLADEASHRITAALAEAAEVLTPAQRADLARRWERRFGGRG